MDNSNNDVPTELPTLEEVENDFICLVLALDAHTEAPYYCSFKSFQGHSPAPSALILTARWNPKNEATTIIPMHDVIEKLGAHDALALTHEVFNLL